MTCQDVLVSNTDYRWQEWAKQLVATAAMLRLETEAKLMHSGSLMWVGERETSSSFLSRPLLMVTWHHIRSEIRCGPSDQELTKVF